MTWLWPFVTTHGREREAHMLKEREREAAAFLTLGGGEGPLLTCFWGRGWPKPLVMWPMALVAFAFLMYMLGMLHMPLAPLIG